MAEDERLIDRDRDLETAAQGEPGSTGASRTRYAVVLGCAVLGALLLARLEPSSLAADFISTSKGSAPVLTRVVASGNPSTKNDFHSYDEDAAEEDVDSGHTRNDANHSGTEPAEAAGPAEAAEPASATEREGATEPPESAEAANHEGTASEASPAQDEAEAEKAMARQYAFYPLNETAFQGGSQRQSRKTWKSLRSSFKYAESTPIWLADAMPHPVGAKMCFALCNMHEKLCGADIERFIDRTSAQNPYIKSPACPAPMPLPYYATIGYSQAGSTFFAGILGGHRKVHKACRKEIHYFDHQMYATAQLQTNRRRSYFKVKPYLDCLQGSGSGVNADQVVGDNTIKQIYVDAWQPVWFKAINPAIKLMVLLRNPVKRSISRYSMRGASAVCPSYLGPDASLCNGDFDAYVPRMIRFIETECPTLTARGDPSAVYACAVGGTARRVDVDTLVSSMYVLHLRHWLNFFPPESFLLVESDSLFKDGFSEMNRVLGFLGLDPFDRATFARIVSSSSTRQNSHAAKTSGAPQQATIDLLEKFYAPYLDALRDLVADRFGIADLSLEH